MEFEDILEKKKAEEALKESEEKFRELMEQSSIAIQIYSPEGTLIEANKTFRKLFQLSDQQYKEIIGNYNWRKDPQPKKSGLDKHLVKLFNGEPLKSFIHEYSAEETLKDFGIKDTKASTLWVNNFGYPVKNKNGKILHVVMMFEDITEKKKAEEALKESEEKFSKSFHQNPHIVLLSNLKTGEIYDVNDNFEKIVGYSKKEAIGKSTVGLKMWPSPEKRDELKKELQKEKPIKDFEITLLKKSGEEFIALLNVNILDIGKGDIILSTIEDITKIKKAEEALKESEEKYRSYIERSPTGIFIVDEKGKYINVNPGACALLGYTKKELLNLSISDITPPEQLEKGINSFKTLKKDKSVSEEIMLKKKDGSKVYVILDAVSLPDDNYMAYCTDITEKKKAEEALQESEIKLKTFFQRSINAIGVSTKGIHTMVNPAYVELFGYEDEKEIIGMPITELIAKSERKHIIDNVRRREGGEQIPLIYETKGLRKDGTEFDMHVNITIYNLHGEDYTAVILRDITEIKQAEEDLRESEEKFRNIFESSNDMLVYVGKNGKIIDVNKKIIEALKYTREELIGKNIFKLKIIPVKELATMSRKFLSLIKNKEGSKLIELSIKAKDGKTIPIEVSTQIIKKRENTEGIIAIMRNITERKKTEQEIQERNKEIKKTKEFLQSMMDSSPNIIISVDGKGKVKTWNKSAEIITGYKDWDILNKEIWDLGIFEFEENIKDFIQEEYISEVSLDCLVTCKNQSKKSFNFTTFPIETSKEQEGFVFSGREIPQKIQSPIFGKSYFIEKSKKSHDTFTRLIGPEETGIFISRETPETIKALSSVRSIKSVILDSEIYNTNEGLDGLLKSLESKCSFEKKKKNNCILLLERVGYLSVLFGFQSFMKFLYSLNDLIKKNNSILIVNLDKSSLSEKEISLIKEELNEFPEFELGEHSEQLEPELIEILKLVSKNSSKGIATSFKHIKDEFNITNNTTRKRITILLEKEHIHVKKTGRTKNLFLNEKAKKLIQE